MLMEVMISGGGHEGNNDVYGTDYAQGNDNV
jgi:hypothetical protein